MRGYEKDHPKVLVVEGQDDLYTIAELMGHYVDWPNSAPPVAIVAAGGKARILDNSLPVRIKAQDTRMVGVVLDADDSVQAKYQRVCQLVSPLFPAIPAEGPVEGLIVDNEDGKRFGLWVMPDNRAPGDLETFLRLLVPSENEQLWGHACISVDEAIKLGADCKENHRPKANLFTWLAWQDPPGQSPGRALTQKILDPLSPHAAGFIVWFKKLYRL